MAWSNRTIPKSVIRKLDLQARIDIEKKLTDAEAEEISFEQLTRKETSFEKFVDLRWRRYLFDFFGPIKGKTVLDLGCGYSNKAIIFALAGATVCASDVSPKAVATVERLAEFNNIADRVTAKVCPAEALDFEDEQFDLIFGDAVLHHLDLRLAGSEIARVLKKGGKGGFVDGLGHNVVFEFARDYLPYRWKSGLKGVDLPLRIESIERFGSNFSLCEYRAFQLCGVLIKPFRLKEGSGLRTTLESVDDWMFDRFPYMQRYARLVSTRVMK
jgi:SAM-dependent methyltransferase